MKAAIIFQKIWVIGFFISVKFFTEVEINLKFRWDGLRFYVMYRSFGNN